MQTLLVLTSNPQRASFRQRIGVYLPELAARGITCTIAVLPAGTLARARLFRSARAHDAVFLHKKLLNPVDAFILRRYSHRLIYNYDDAVMVSHRRPERASPSRLLAFRRTARLADLIIVGSPYLAEQAHGLNDAVRILPIGLDTAAYRVREDGETDGKTRLVWIGSASTLKYLTWLCPVLEKIGKAFPDVSLRIVGDTFFDLRHMPVERIPWRRETLARDLAGADIGLGPLPRNPFTEGKCSFKILEYACSGLPVVASPVGTNRVFVKEGETGFLVGNEAQWQDRLTRLIGDRGLRRRMGRAGRRHAARFDVSVIGRRLFEILSHAMGLPEGV
jgi:glycosyltransferase involved in cell wall biosynthesis